MHSKEVVLMDYEKKYKETKKLLKKTYDKYISACIKYITQ